jgi:hypothetical protein
MPEVERVLGNAAKTAPETGSRPNVRSISAWAQRRKSLSAISLQFAKPLRTSSRALSRARASCRYRTAAIMLHVLHHSLWPRALAIRADGRNRRANPASRRNDYRGTFLLASIYSLGNDLPGNSPRGLVRD